MRPLVHDLVASVHAACEDDRSGDILRGIPALEDVDPDSFGICVSTRAPSSRPASSPGRLHESRRTASTESTRRTPAGSSPATSASSPPSSSPAIATGRSATCCAKFGILDGDPNDAHEVYLRACSTMLDCRDLSLMGATLANGGVHPLTGERALATDLTERVLSVMSTCGMYDAAGEWVAQVGLAAKSGVGGEILAVLPGQLSIAVFSPRLDEHGNSVRAFKACRQLSQDLELHAMHVARAAHGAIRDSYDIVEAPSSIQRPEADRRTLERHGRKARIYKLHGDLLFAGAESVVREISEVGGDLELLAADVRRITDVAGVSRKLLLDLVESLREQGCEAFLIDPDGLLAGLGASGDGAAPAFPSVAAATTHFEERLLERYGERREEEAFEFTAHPALAGVPSRIVDELGRRLQRRTYADGEQIVAEGDADAGVFMVISGRVRSSLTTASGATRNLATLTPGACFGDVYVVTGNPHPVSIHAEGPVEALELTREAFARMREEDLELRAAVLEILMFEIHEDVNRALRSLATSRVAPMTAS